MRATKSVIASFLLLLSPFFMRSARCGEEDEQFRKTVEVDHQYYRLHLFKNNEDGMYDRHLVDLSQEAGASTHEFLSGHSQAAEAVDPGFQFPFYGHMVERFYVTTHGFLSFAPRLHNLMYKTQYIAPLRVKLDPGASTYATVDYLAKEDRLTVQWTNVSVAEPYQHPMGGEFTFQVTLHENGDIYFVYLEVPELLNADALYDDEPVAGLSDAFLIGDSELHVYHTVNIPNPDIMSRTVVKFTSKPTCIQQQSCEECAILRETSDFACTWCSKVHRCSDGADRLREHWDSSGCQANNVTGPGACAEIESEDAPHTEWRGSGGDPLPESVPVAAPAESGGVSAGVVVSGVVSAVLVLLLATLLVGFVYMYGKGNPGSFAERIALRLETNYKRFGRDSFVNSEATSVEMGRAPAQVKQDNNNSITVSF